MANFRITGEKIFCSSCMRRAEPNLCNCLHLPINRQLVQLSRLADTERHAADAAEIGRSGDEVSGTGRAEL
ncbi:unnamed protein product [Gongylonema pulchrum]|uniref:Uncharacterized protein n=1 Tax=Gongylonema pulchrum TaxID=637853 RepID=A0A183EKU8_9BILA|nr:unnamed protein product [Gongylonema pulchrum]